MKRPRCVLGCYVPAERAAHFAARATPEEVEEVLENRLWPALWVRSKSLGKSPAYLVYGRTAEGRYLFIPGIVFSDPPLRGLFMPATARPMTERERRYYERHRGVSKV